ncbi:MAG TPA: alpha-amylase family glycosyl hydrolase, partial [Acidobacteriaceae bacterium]|nr:alpha-amylase family glycosyl hydrolase [Acidobacteriaceae bacterium]
ALRDVFLKGQPFSRLDEMWRMDALYPHPERLVPFLGNHDTPRFLNESGATPRQLELAFAVLLTMRGTPQIYSGDEIAMHGGEDPDNRRDFPGGFPADPQSAFSAATRTPDQRELHDWVRSLLQLRKIHSALQDGEEQVLKAEGAQLVFARTTAHEHLLIAVNNSDQPTSVDIPIANTAIEDARGSQTLFGAGDLTFRDGQMTLKLPPRGVILASLRTAGVAP